jgi:hypothetical protein
MPPPATSVDACTDDGFHLNSGARIDGGDGVLHVSREAFRWRPWVAKRSKPVNSKGQWEVLGEVLTANNARNPLATLRLHSPSAFFCPQVAPNQSVWVRVKTRPPIWGVVRPHRRIILDWRDRAYIVT